ncbi:MAG: CDP-alcohol phosphatidyltransferase family protein [Firmicutes bacterium]|nr:CDP-alcohol phosphatidyltransferase family protein [Bacillota bacterium]
MLGFYNYTVILTYIGLLVGFGGILSAMGGNTLGAILCLMGSGLCDMFDGKIAATMERTPSEKQFGIQIDSLSDLVCFGVLPAVLVYQSNEHSAWLCGGYVLCALIRLAWFNVDEQARQEHTQERRREYRGLPVTTAALIFPVLFGLEQFYSLSFSVSAPVVMLVTASAFLTPFRVKKPHFERRNMKRL